MTQLRSKATIFLEERLRPAFAPSTEVRRRMREAVLTRAAEASAASSAAAAAGQASVAGAKNPGRRSALRYLSTLSAGVLVLGASAVGLNHVANRELRPVAAERHAGDSESQHEARVAPGGGGAPATQESVDIAPTPSSAPPPEALGSPHQLPDAPQDRNARRAATREPVARVLPAAPISNDAKATEERPQPHAEHTEDLLGEEARLIREAQIGLRAGEVGRARKSLEEHARAFPRGVLRDERLALEVLLLCAEGQTERAQRAAAELLRANPLSSHSESLRASCARASVP